METFYKFENTVDGINVLDAVEVAKFIRSMEAFPAHLSTKECLQRILDEDADEYIKKMQYAVKLEDLLRRILECVKNHIGDIIGSDLQDEIGITQEQYDSIMNG